jgi:hypothetical protein
MLMSSEIAYIELNTDYDVFNSLDGMATAMSRCDGTEVRNINIHEMLEEDIISYLILCSRWANPVEMNRINNNKYRAKNQVSCAEEQVNE